MRKVSPESAEAPRRAGTRGEPGFLGGAAEVVDAGGGHDGCELRLHSGFPSMDSNVDPRLH